MGPPTPCPNDSLISDAQKREILINCSKDSATGGWIFNCGIRNTLHLNLKTTKMLVDMIFAKPRCYSNVIQTTTDLGLGAWPTSLKILESYPHWWLMTSCLSPSQYIIPRRPYTGHGQGMKMHEVDHPWQTTGVMGPWFKLEWACAL